MAVNKTSKKENVNEFSNDMDSVVKKKRRKNEIDSAKSHQKNVSDNSIVYTSHSCGPNIQKLIDSKVSMHASTGFQASYSPYVSSN
jgi:hypothetical protein